MRTVKLLAALLAALLVVALIACGDDDDDRGDASPTDAPATSATAQETDPPADSAFPLTVTDDAGIEFTFDEAPQSIVALAPSFVEVLYAVGAGDAIVAADQNTDYPPEAADIPRISGFDPSVEAIAGYEPDLVLMCCFDAGGLQGALMDIDIPTMYFDSPATIDGVYEQIVTIGEVVGAGNEVEAIVGGMEADIDAIVSAIPARGHAPSYYFELDVALFTVGPGSFPHEVFTLLGAENVADATGEAYPQLSAEAIIAGAPDVIFLADADFGESAETVASRPGWDVIPAVVNDRVYPVPAAVLSRPTPRLVDDIELVADLLYPES
ncbi:MAG TPA: ABC transporter substrate-binding protein [Dehalococcoidia bacterium]|nr:ABC transporter substrate-binding protein [Dehalococcoidia bacterium]